MSDSPLVSILINNHDYARFLRAAIDSALYQTYPVTEVIRWSGRLTEGLGFAS